jgi:LPS O-antigen subunit length determinant protein (WzzB/FepE family)
MGKRSNSRMWPNGLAQAVLVGILAGLVATGFMVVKPNKYRSDCKILPVDAKATGGLAGLASLAANFGASLPGGDGGEANFVDIVNSRWMRDRLLDTVFDFHAKSWLFGENKAYHQTLREFVDRRNEDRQRAAVGEILGASKDLKTKILLLTAETPSPELSQALLQRTTELLETFVIQRGRTRGGQKALFAEARVKDARAELAKAEADFRGFLMANRGYQTSTDPGVRLEGMRHEMEMKLRQTLALNLSMNLEQALLEEKNDVPILNIMDKPNLPKEKSGPRRSLIGLAATLLGAAGAMLWSNRDPLRALLWETEPESRVEEA